MSDEFKIELTDEVKQQMEADPELAKAMQELFAKFHQAHHDVEVGKYSTLQEAMEVLTGHPVERVGEADPDADDDEDVLVGFEVTKIETSD